MCGGAFGVDVFAVVLLRWCFCSGRVVVVMLFGTEMFFVVVILWGVPFFGGGVFGGIFVLKL